MVKSLLPSFRGVPGCRVVVVDDGSTPSHAESLVAAVSGTEDCTLVRHAASRGAAAARNHGARVVGSEYLWFFDDDDFVSRSDVKTIVGHARRAEVGVMAVRTRYMDRGHEVASYLPTPERDNFDAYRSKGQLVSLPSLVFRRELFERLGGFDTKLVAGQDTDLVLRASRAGPICVLSEAVVDIRLGHGSPRMTTGVRRQLKGKVQFLVKHWSVLSWRRRVYYLGSLAVLAPFWKNLSSRKVPRETAKGSR